jgi:hypothetical protein
MKKVLLSSVVVAGAAVAFAAVNSGLAVGESVSPFHPKHVTGALKGSTACFPCTFKNRPQVQAWLNNPDEATINAFAMAIDKAMVNNEDKEFKGMVVVIADKKLGMMLDSNAAKLQGKFKNVSIAYVDPRHESIAAYKVNTSKEVKNTVFAYRNWKVTNKMVNVEPTEKGLMAVSGAIETLVSSK